MDLPPNDPIPDNIDDDTEFERYRQRTENADITEQSFSAFEGEWLLRSCILRGSLAEIRTFRSRGIIISPISNQNTKAQILDIIRQVTLVLNLRPDWRNLPEDWLAADNAIFPTSKHVNLFIPLRDAVLAGSDGDGVSEFHSEPLNPRSAQHRIYPRCITLAGLKVASLPTGYSQTGGINIFVQFLPQHWQLDHLTEALVFRNFPLDLRGDITRLLLHYLDEFITHKLQAVNLVIDYTLLVVPILVQPTRLEAVGLVLLPPLRPGINLTHLARLHTLVGLKDAMPALLSLGWTSLLMGSTRGEVLNPAHLSHIQSAAPLEMRVTGLERGLPLSTLLTAVWTDSSFSPHFFEHIAAAYITRSVIYSHHPTFFMDTVLRAHGAADTLHLILRDPSASLLAPRPTVGRELRTLVGINSDGLYAIPDHGCLYPKPIDLYITLSSTHRAVQPRSPSTRVGSEGRGRSGARPRASGRVRTPSVPTSASTSARLLQVDAGIAARYQAMVSSHPLMADVIPEGQLIRSVLGRHSNSLGFLSQPSAHLSMRTTATTWMTFQTSSTRRTKVVTSRHLLPSLMEVCPTFRISSSEWFLFAPSSGVRDNGLAANRLCTWLANKLCVLIRSVTHATSLLNLHNLSIHEFCPDIAFYVPGTSTRNENAVAAQSDLDDDDFLEYLAYRNRVLGGGAPPAVPVDQAPPSALPPLLAATPDFTVVTCTLSARTTLSSLCSITEDELDYLQYREKVLKLDGLTAQPSSDQDPMRLLSNTTTSTPVPVVQLSLSELSPSAPIPPPPAASALTSFLQIGPSPAQTDPAIPRTHPVRRHSHRVFPPNPLPVDSFLPFFLSYALHCLPQRYRHIPGLLRHRLLASVPEYNPVASNSYTRRLQDLHYVTTTFRPPPCRDLRHARRVVSLFRQGPRQCLRNLLFLSTISLGVSHLPRACHRLAFLPQFQTPPVGYFCPREAGRSVGGGKRPSTKRSRNLYSDPSQAGVLPAKPRKKKKPPLLPGATSPIRRSSKSERSPDPCSRSPPKKKTFAPSAVDSPPSSFSLTPSQEPGQTRPLADIRQDPRIAHQGPAIGIAPTLLPFTGEGLFSKTELYFPIYDSHGKKKRWSPLDLAICEYRGVHVRHTQAILPSYQSAYLCTLDPEWDIDAQEYTSCYGRFANDNFQDKTINCRLCPYTAPGSKERKLYLIALPGVRILPGEELYASYGPDYWLDHLPTLPREVRLACLHKYQYQPGVLLKAGLLRDGSRTSDSATNIRQFFKPERCLLASRALPDQKVSPSETFSLLFSSLSPSSSPYRETDTYEYKRAALYEYLENEPVLQLHLQEPSSMYRVCAPDGSCGIQLALLYWLLPDADWSPTFLASGYQSAFLKFKRRETGSQQPQILAALRQLLSERAPPGSHVHRTLQLWHDGLSLNNNTPITHLEDYLELREVCSLIREGSNSSLFTECAESAIDSRSGRVPATLYYDARFPTRTQQFSAKELRHILSHLHRPSVLRGQHFYPFGSDPNYAPWLTQALDQIVQRLLPPPGPSPPPSQSLDADSILSQITISSTPVVAHASPEDPYAVLRGQDNFSDLFDTGFFSVHHQRQPIVFQEGEDLRLWFSPTKRSDDIHLVSSAPQTELAHLVETGQIHLGCAVRASSLALPVNLCRPDGSCGLQLACVALLEQDPWVLHTQAPWYFASPARMSLLQHTLAKWVHDGSLPPATLAKIKGTLAWLSQPTPMLPVRFWFTNVDVHHVLRYYHRTATLWTQPPGDEWADWLVLDCSTASSVLASRATYRELADSLSPVRLHGALTQSHFSPWRAPETLLAALPQALRGLISESMPGSHPHQLGVPTTVAILTGQPGVVILSRPSRLEATFSQHTPVTPVPCSSPDSPDTEVTSPSASSSASGPPIRELPASTELCPRDLSSPSSAAAPAASSSLLHRPGRPLTLADFPTPTPPSIPSPPGSPYHQRFPAVTASPPDLRRGPCPPIGIWPSAASRKRTSKDWYETLLDPAPTPHSHGYQPLQSTGGPFSVFTALLATMNYGPDTVLTLWKRAELYLTQAWTHPDCYLSEDSNLHTSHSLGGRRKQSLSTLSGLVLPYVPSLLEVFQRLCSQTIHPVMFYILSGAYSGPLQVIDTVSSQSTWYQVENHSSLLKRFPRNPFLTLLDSRGAVHGTSGPSTVPFQPDTFVPTGLTPYYPPSPSPAKPPEDRNAFGSTALSDFLHLYPEAFELNHHGDSGLENDFRIVYFNINGLDGFKHAELLAFMSSSSVDCLVLIDARVPKQHARHYLRETRAELGPGAICLVSSPSPTSSSADDSDSIKVGGNVIILNARWGPSLVQFKSDPSGLCVVDEAIVGTAHGRLQILATYWPFPTPLTSGSTDDIDGRTRRGLYHRLTSYLKSDKSPASPLSYVQSTIQFWMHRHMSTPGNHSLCGGDFNCCWDGRPDGVGYATPLREWADAIGYSSRHSVSYPNPAVFITRPSSNLLGGTEIDHVLHTSPSMIPSQYDTGSVGGLWLGMSDHRPVVASYGGLLPHGSRERFSRAYSQTRTLHISRFRPSPKQLKDYQDALATSWVRLDGPPASPDQATCQLQHLTDISLTASLTRKRWKVRNRYKEHWSPTYAALQAQLVAMIRIQRHLGILPLPPRLRKWDSPLEIQQGISNVVREWEKTVSSLTFHGGVPPEVWGTGLTPQEWRSQDVSNSSSLRLAALSTFKLLRANLHARKRKEYSTRVSAYIAQREENILVADVHGAIQSLLNERPANPPLEQYDFGDAEYTPRNPEELHHYLTEMFDRHFQSLPTPAPALHNGTLSWDDIAHGSFEDFRRHYSSLNIPLSDGDRPDTLHVLWEALRTSPRRDRVQADLQVLLSDPPSLDEFTAILHDKAGHSSGGPSGLQYKHVQNWSPAMVSEAYHCLVTMWTQHHTPDAWKWKWLVPIPKGSSDKIQDMRPIMLMEVLRKLWTGLIVKRITTSLQKHGVLSLNQHGYLPKRGTDTANLQLLNTLETAWDEQRSLYGCSWDMKKAFDSVSKPLILLCWQRLGVPLAIAQWLVDLDEAGYTIVRTPYALEKWDLAGLEGIRHLSFNPERGTGQGDIHSPFTWLAVFDVLLTMLENTPSTEHQFLLRRPDGSLYVARDICFADDLQSFGSTLEGLQRTADLVSTYAMVFNLSIASHKLRAFYFRGMASPPPDPLHILVHGPGWIPQPVFLKSEGTFKSLGVEYPINPGDSTSFALMKRKLLVSIRAISIKKASARAVNTVISKCLYNRGAYVGVLSSWSLAQCEELDKIFATEIRRRTKNMKSSQLENLFQPAREGGLGYQRISDIIQHRKRSSINRILRSGDHWSRWAADALLRRGHRLPHHLPLPAITPQLVRPGFWVSSLIEYGWKGNACLTKQTSQPTQQAYPSLHQSLVGSPIPGHKWSPSNLKCLHAFHLSTYGDLVTWDRASSHWSWREVNGPKALEGALSTLALPQDTAVPLLPGQAWHLSSDKFLAGSSTITEIMFTNLSPTAWGYSLTVLYRRWHLLTSPTSPPPGTILRNPSRLLVYHGSMATHDWFPEIFGTLDTCATLLTLVTSPGHPTPPGALPGALSTLDALPLTVEIYRSVPFLPPSYVGHSRPAPPILEPRPSTPTAGSPTTHVYLAFHASTGYSPLHQAVNHGVHRLSLSLLHTTDHDSWTSLLFCDTLDRTHARPTAQAVLLMGILRALWDHHSSSSDTPLILHIPDPALVKSLRSPPSTFSSEVTEWLNGRVQLLLSPLVSIQHSGPVPTLPDGSTPSELGMYLAQSYASTGISPLSPDLLAPGPPIRELAFSILPFADCFPVGALHDSWSWRDLFTGDPLLVPLEHRVQCLRRIQAQRDRDQNRAQRLDPPIWEDVTMSFASKVLDLPCLPQGSRCHYEKLLHERHWTVGHNSSKEAATPLERRTLLTCSLCSSPDRHSDDTYDHVFRLCPHPLLHHCRTELNRQLDQYPLHTDLEQRLIPHIIQLVLSPEGHRICLGNWNSIQLTSLSSVLTSTDTPEAIEAVLLDFSRFLVPRIESIWEARKQAKYIEAVEHSDGADPVTLRVLQRKFKPFSPRPIKEPKVFYGVRLGHVPGVYTSWKEAKPHTIGIRSDYKKFKTRRKAEEYIAQPVTLGQPPLPNPDVVLYTDGSASLDPPSAGWGVFISRSLAPSASVWGPVITDSSDPDWIGALRPTNNAGEICAFYHALLWVRGGARSSSSVARKRINLLTDSEYCVRLFGDNSIKPRSNKVLIQRVRSLLSAVRRHHDLSISWVKAHTGLATTEAVGNAKADCLAARGRTGSSGATVHPSLTSSRSLRRRTYCGPTDPRRRPRRRLPLSSVLRPSHFAHHLSLPDRAILLRVARSCRDISPAPAATTPVGFGDTVGD